MKFEELSPNLDRNAKLLFVEGNRKYQLKIKSLLPIDRAALISEINEYYFSKGWGLKLLARNVLGTTYTKCRCLFAELGIQFRTGSGVATEHTRNFRRLRANTENKAGTGFNSSDTKRYAKATRRGVQGYYYNTSTSDYVWLRSTYEFIYAKFLNKIGVNWKFEQKSFDLPDGTRYTPDFFVYDKDWNLEKIIEIKGYWDNRAYKAEMLKQDQFKDSKVDIVLINDIKTYISDSLTYTQELETWKKIRKSKEQKLQE